MDPATTLLHIQTGRTNGIETGSGGSAPYLDQMTDHLVTATFVSDRLRDSNTP